MASRIVKKWFADAEGDLRAAETLIAVKRVPFFVKGFHIQQGVEKAIKGYLSAHRKRFPKTHDIKFLSKKVIALDPSLENLLKPTYVLGKYAVETRYPSRSKSRVSTATLRSQLKHAKVAVREMKKQSVV